MDLSNARDRWLPMLLLFLAIGLLSSGCDSTDDTIAGDLTYSVFYKVETDVIPGTGSAQLVRVVYDDGEGNEVEQTVFSDPRSFETAVPMVSGDTFFLRAEGMLVAASILIQVQVQASDGSMFARSNNTPYDNGTLFVQIPRETLR